MDTLKNQVKNINEMVNSSQKRNEFNDRIARLTGRYQKIYNFEIRDKIGNEFWNNEADAFKHAFGSAVMSFEMGSLGSTLGGIQHEDATPDNPEDERNMDSWNNAAGRKIALQIKKKYGEKAFLEMPQRQKEDIIAHNVMVAMKNGDLITKPEDKRRYNYIKELPQHQIYNAGKTLIELSQKKQPKKASSNPNGWTEENPKLFLKVSIPVN